MHCGVEPALPREYIESRRVAFLKDWTLGEEGKYWYGGDTDKYAAAVAMANKVISTVESGGHITDENGQILDEYKNNGTFV